MSYSQFKRSSLGPLGSVFLKFMRVFGMVAVEEEVGEDKNEIRVNNLTLINFVLKFIGPTHEQTLTVYMMVIQVCRTLCVCESKFNPLCRFLGHCLRSQCATV